MSAGKTDLDKSDIKASLSELLFDIFRISF
jgi:hypothetical protein